MSFEACGELVRQGDPDRFMAVMSAPVEQREKLFTLYAFNLEIARAPWVTKEAMIAEMRLQWWRDVIDDIYDNKQVGDHPVVTPLNKMITDHALPKDLFERMIIARRWDIYQDPHADDAGLQQYLGDTSGCLMALGALATGAKGDAADTLINYGRATGHAAYLSAIPALKNAQRQPLLDERDQALKTLAHHALKEAKNAHAILMHQPKQIRPTLRSAWMAKPLLKLVCSDPSVVMKDNVKLSEIYKKFRLLQLSLRNKF